MAKRHDDDEWKQIRPGDINSGNLDSLFDNDPTNLEQWKFEDEDGNPIDDIFDHGEDEEDSEEETFEESLADIANKQENTRPMDVNFDRQPDITDIQSQEEIKPMTDEEKIRFIEALNDPEQRENIPEEDMNYLEQIMETIKLNIDSGRMPKINRKSFIDKIKVMEGYGPDEELTIDNVDNAEFKEFLLNYTIDVQYTEEYLEERKVALNYSISEMTSNKEAYEWVNKLQTEFNMTYEFELEDKEIKMNFEEWLVPNSDEMEIEYHKRMKKDFCMNRDRGHLVPLHDDLHKFMLPDSSLAVPVRFARMFDLSMLNMFYPDGRIIRIAKDKIDLDLYRNFIEPSLYKDKATKIMFELLPNRQIHAVSILEDSKKPEKFYDNLMNPYKNLLRDDEDSYHNIIEKYRFSTRTVRFFRSKENPNEIHCGSLGTRVGDDPSIPNEELPILITYLESQLDEHLLKYIKWNWENKNPDIFFNFEMDYRGRIIAYKSDDNDPEPSRKYKCYPTIQIYKENESEFLGYLGDYYKGKTHCVVRPYFNAKTPAEEREYLLIYNEKDKDGEQVMEVLKEIELSNDVLDSFYKACFKNYQVDCFRDRTSDKIIIHQVAPIEEKEKDVTDTFNKTFYMWDDDIRNRTKSETEDLEKLVVKSEEKEENYEESIIEPDIGQEDEMYEDILMRFDAEVINIMNKYTFADVLYYIKHYKDYDLKDIMLDNFNNCFVKYEKLLDRNNIDDYQNYIDAFWIIAAGKFCDSVEKMKTDGTIESTVETKNYSEDNHTVEDPHIVELRKRKEDLKKKYDQYKIDRVVFAIADETEEDNSSIFDEKRALMKEFYETEFYDIIEQVMESNRYFDMSKVRCQVTINEDTSYIPVVDFNTGIRLICIRTSDTDQFHISPYMISKKVPYQFKGIGHRDLRIRPLYEDNCRERPIATVSALKKLIAYKYMKDKYKVTLAHNYVLSYTTDQFYIDRFEKGDPDSDRAENSTYATDKPRNMSIGLLLVDKKSKKDRQTMRRNQIYRDLGGKENELSVDNYDIQMVMSAGIIRNDTRLRDYSLSRNERFVEYTISQYNECNPCVLLDGFQILVACIIKEHKLNYDPDIKFSISFELDRDNLVSPAVIGMIDEQDGIMPSMIRRAKPMDVMTQFILPKSRASAEGVYPFEIGRLDPRMMNPIAIQRRYPESLWKRYDLNNTQSLHEFIRSRGFEEFLVPRIILFDIMPFSCASLEASSIFNSIEKVQMNILRDKNSSETERMLYRQKEMEYIKSLDGSSYSMFQKIVIGISNFLANTFGNGRV